MRRDPNTETASKIDVDTTVDQRKLNIYISIAFVVGILVLALFVILVFWFATRLPPPECGVIPGKQTPLIINGTEATVEEFPFYVSIKPRRFRNPHCGGSIIAPLWVLTAQHCVYADDIIEICKHTGTEINLDCLEVVAGSVDSIDTSKGTIHRVIDIKPFMWSPKYRHEEDIAVLFVSPPFKYKSHSNSSRGVASICLPEKDDKVTEKQSDLVGVGVVSEFHRIPATKLMTTKLNNLDIDGCLEIYLKGNTSIEDVDEDFKSRFICAGISEESKGGCYGDSGGPLSVTRNNKAVQVGVAVLVPGTGCGEKSTVFISVMYYREWIRHITGV